MSVIEKRYPQLLFLRTITSFESANLVEGTKVVPPEADLLYIYGVDDGGTYKSLKKWLDQDSRRELVFIEDDMGCIDALMQRRRAEKVFANPQVHLRFVMETASLEVFAQEIAEEFPALSAEFISLKGQSKVSSALGSLLKRKTVVEAAHLQEHLYHPRLLPNILANILRWEESLLVRDLKGKFTGTPAVICGAGPSLANHIEHLSALEESSIIMAGGSAITLLGRFGLVPHMAFVIDPNADEYTRLRQNTAFETPIFYACRTIPEVMHSFNGPSCYMSTCTGGPLEEYFEQELGIFDPSLVEYLDPEAMSVTTMALAVAIFLGCDPITFVGVDLAFSEMSRYPTGFMSTMQLQIEERNLKGRTSEQLLCDAKESVTTTLKWQMEAKALSRMIKPHSDRRFFNLSKGGLPIDGADPIEDLAFPICDIRGKIHMALEACEKNVVSGEKIHQHIELLTKSLIHAQALVEESLSELEKLYPSMRLSSPKLVVLESDLEEEIAYQVLLKPSIYALNLELIKQHRTEEKRDQFAIKSKLWSHLARMIKEYIWVLKRYST